MPSAWIQACTVVRIGVVITPPQSVMTPRNSSPLTTLIILDAASPGAGTSAVGPVKVSDQRGDGAVTSLARVPDAMKPDFQCVLTHWNQVSWRSASACPPEVRRHGWPSRVEIASQAKGDDRPGRQNVGGLRYNRSSRRLMRTCRWGPFAVVRILRTGRRDMPSARTPDPPPSLTGLRLVQVPGGWPPYDCETHGAACPMAPPAQATDVEASPAWAGAAPPSAAGAAGPGPAAGAADGAAATVWPRRFAQAIVEVLAGTRPPKQLASHTTEPVRAQIG